MPKKKKFIDKKNAVTYHLVHRSQRDPLQADEEAPQRVLKAVGHEDKDKKEEEQNYGIYFDDDYDYMQHLRSVKEMGDVEPIESFRIESKSKDKEQPIILPPEVFASTSENPVGLLNQAAPQGPQLDWDPEVMAAMDDDFDFEDPDNELDDDFVAHAMAEGGDDSDDSEEDMQFSSAAMDRVAQFAAEQRLRFGGKLEESEDDGSVGEESDTEEEDAEDAASDEADYSDDDMGSEVKFGDEETKSRFTNYSMSSSVIRRNDGLTLLDDRFEKLYEQYDDEEIGALDHEDIAGTVTQGSELLNSVLEDFQIKNKKVSLKDVVQPAGDVDDASESSDSDIVEMQMEDKKEKWDCESILSTYSNLYNHPKLIEEPKKIKPIELTKRVGLPADVLKERGPTKKQLEREEHLISQLDPAPTYRPTDETLQEKKARKKAVKEERKLRRETKKSTKEAFKAEKKKQVKEILNVQQAMKGVKIV